MNSKSQYNPYEYRSCNNGSCGWTGTARNCRTLRPSTDPLCPACGETTEFEAEFAPQFEPAHVDQEVDNVAQTVEEAFAKHDLIGLNAMLTMMTLHTSAYHERVLTMALRSTPISKFRTRWATTDRKRS